MQGRVILGPEGGASARSTCRLRFAVVQETIESKVITTKLDRIPVAIPPSDSNVLFTHVTEGLDFPMPKGDDIDSYVIYIGFDPAGAGAEEAQEAGPEKPARLTPAARAGRIIFNSK